MTPGARPAHSLPNTVHAELDQALAAVDAELDRRYPGDPGDRQPVHTVYVPADRYTADTPADWGRAALALLDQHAPDAASFAAAVGAPAGPAEGAEAAEQYARVRAKLADEPVEDLRIDFEDGFAPRPAAEEEAVAADAAHQLAAAVAGGQAPPFAGIRCQSLEAAVRDRAVRVLDVFLSTLLSHGPLPAGLRLTLPKVSHPGQATAMAGLCAALERALGLPEGRLRFEIQVETPAAVLGPDGTATVARLLDATEGRLTGLHYGTFDYSAALGISAAHQAPDHPAADHAKAVMQLAAAGTGVRLSDGSTQVLPVGPPERVRAAWHTHHRLVTRALARGYYQGWDMHPGHLPTRYAAVYAFYRAGLPDAAGRLADYAAGTQGALLDEPATARALAGFLLRGLRCGALAAAEVTGRTGLTLERVTEYAAPRPASGAR
ncbi:aldolase/citrate lyase family protein [Streptomyces sp. DSM 44915]|uniref:Aldolase/citrate lyase family protein n=1 Tax=Streptomyces chisholmiae TaxID=3075540 RepID=A0ABU2JLW7_9ACTN|nr:aldolase/citrate lyase family protein [Streptomyces sp. DSM 44915]MDT0265964.1 aldolase/citrate lyase family protein [Streptomyces sp. DSM 44915]